MKKKAPLCSGFLLSTRSLKTRRVKSKYPRAVDMGAMHESKLIYHSSAAFILRN